MARTTSTASTAGFVVDYNTEERDHGHQIDWDNVASDGTYGTTGERVIPAGTAVGETAGGIAPASDTVEAIGLLVASAVEGERSHASTGYGVFVGGRFYENLLPSYAAGEPWTTNRAELVALGFRFTTYENDAAV